MAMENHALPLYLACFLFIGGALTNALPYDYSATTDCLKNPLKPQYNGGVIINAEINNGLNGWSTHGGGKIEHRSSENGNTYLVAHSRQLPYHSMSQKVFLHKEKYYTFSAWVQVSGKTNELVTAVFKTNRGFKHAAKVIAKQGCWSMLKGGLTVDSSTPAEFFFQSNDTSIDIWVDNVSLQPFTQEEWRAHHDQTIENIRKSKVKLQIKDPKGNPLPNTKISLSINKLSFPFGAAINQNILNNQAYQNWFTQRFTVTTFENEMKWYSTESTRGKEDYSTADAMLNFANTNGIFVRGHNIFWDDPSHQPNWLPNLATAEIGVATETRLKSIVSRYSGQVIHWDVNNENLHFNFFESKLGPEITRDFFARTSQTDQHSTLFINEYNTIEDSTDLMSIPSKYLEKIKEVQGNGIKIGIGLESHFKTPNIPYIRSTLDTLATSNLPIWITELDVEGGPNQASYLEQILREVHGHPSVKGIVIWSAWSPQGCYRMCLTDSNFNNLETGNVVDKLIAEWGKGQTVAGTTDANGYFNTSLFHGDYEVRFQPHSITLHEQEQEQSPTSNFQRFRVVTDLFDQTIEVKVQVSP